MHRNKRSTLQLHRLIKISLVQQTYLIQPICTPALLLVYCMFTDAART